MKTIHFLLIMLALQASSTFVLAQEYKYRNPAPELFKIDMKDVGLSPSDRTSLSTNLAEQCRNLAKYNFAAQEFCYRAMSLAFLLDAENRAAIVADSILKRKAYKHVKRPIPLSSDVIKKVKKLTESGKESEIKLAGYLLTVALQIDKDNEDLVYESSF